MVLFARCFLLVFCQLAVGGILSLAVPPFHEIERGYFKSSAGVFFTAGLLGGGGTIYLALTRAQTGITPFEAVAWLVFLLLFALYLSTLWGDAIVARARLFALCLVSGWIALACSAVSLSVAHGFVFVALAIACVWAGAASLGSVTGGMLIGHWYLIDPGMEIEPFRKCFRFFVATVWIEAATSLVALGLFAADPGATRKLLAAYWQLALLRMLLGPAAALAMAALTRRVLAIPQTMAATGLFYIATLAVLVGAFLGRYFTFRTGLPL